MGKMSPLYFRVSPIHFILSIMNQFNVKSGLTHQYEKGVVDTVGLLLTGPSSLPRLSGTSDPPHLFLPVTPYGPVGHCVRRRSFPVVVRGVFGPGLEIRVQVIFGVSTVLIGGRQLPTSHSWGGSRGFR